MNIKTLTALTLTASLLLAGSAGAATLPVITPVSIEINGKTYHGGDTVTVTSPTVSYRVKISYDAAVQISQAGGVAGNPTGKCFGYLCITDSAACVNDHASTSDTKPGLFSTYDDSTQTAITISGTISAQGGANILQAVYSTKADQFLGMSGLAEQAVATGGTITLNYVIPPAVTLSSNGNALASTGKLTAATSQSLSATVMAGSADQAGNGQVYVAANLPASFGAAAGLYFMDAGKLWVKYTGGALTPYKSGSLANAVSVDMGAFDLTGFSGTTIYVGYGVGAGAAADVDVVTGKYSSWMVQ